MRGLLLVFLFGICTTFLGQNSDLQEVLKVLSLRYDEVADYEDMAALLTDRSSNPIAINNTSKEELEQLFFLTDEQIENILYSHYMQGDFTSPFQLQRVDGLDSAIIRCMIPFLHFSPSQHVVKYHVRGGAVARVSSCFETPQGYKSIGGAPKKYSGNRLNQMVRFNLMDNQKSEIGFVAEKDAGELYLDSATHLPDHLSAFYQLKDKGIVRNLVVGDYNASFGQGLVMGQGMMVGKSNEAVKIKCSYSGIRRHLSTVESGFCRGAALLLGNRKYSTTLFGSFNRVDASLTNDTLTFDNQIQTIYNTGLHRTTSELESKNRSSELFYGASVQRRFVKGSIETGVVGYTFWDEFVRKTDLYLLPIQRDRQGWNGFVAFNYISNRFRFFGETAMSHQQAVALTGGCLIKASNRVQLAIQSRKIAKDYFSPRLRTFSESSSGSGESGVYMGCKIGLASSGILSGYVDVFKFDWLRYQIIALTKGGDWMVQYQRSLSSRIDAEIRVKGGCNELMESSAIRGGRGVVPESFLNGRILLTSQISKSVEWASRVDFSRGELNGIEVGTGVVLTQDFKIKPADKRYAIFLRSLLFDVDEVGSRIYIYEPDLLYSYSSQSFEGKGVRGVVGGSFRLNRWLTLSAKIGRTRYSDRASIGSSADEIISSHKTDGKIQLQVRF